MDVSGKRIVSIITVAASCECGVNDMARQRDVRCFCKMNVKLWNQCKLRMPYSEILCRVALVITDVS
jgi:hypothetical protein